MIAEGLLRNAVALDPSHAGSRLDLCALLLDRGEVALARTHFDTLNSGARNQSAFETVLERLLAAEIAEGLPPITLLARRIRRDASDLEARFELAELLISKRDFAPAMQQLLEIVRRDRKFRDDIARLKLLAVFEMAAEEQELVAEFRSRLSSLLF